MSYQITVTDTFEVDLARSPKHIQKAYQKQIKPELRSEPNKVKGDKIKRLDRFKGLWRYRQGDYRFVYRVESRDVTLLIIDHRSKVYGRLDRQDDGSPGNRVIAAQLEDFLEEEPTEQEVGAAIDAIADEDLPSADSVEPLPCELTSELLGQWGVPAEFHSILANVTTVDELLEVDLPSDIHELVLNYVYPKNIEEVMQEPVRIVPEAHDGLGDEDTELDPIHLLLRLDSEQKKFVSRFNRPSPQGPWLLKGSPGSGKTVAALYCIKALLDQESTKLPGQRRPLKILVATFTKSLTNAAEQLTHHLMGDNHDHEVHCRTVNSLALDATEPRTPGPSFADSREIRDVARVAIDHCKHEHPRFPFSRSDVGYLLDEIDWIIVGQELRSFDQYAKHDRRGRRRRLGTTQREAVWAFFEVLFDELEKSNLTLWVDVFRDARDYAEPTYDYVFIDEAQDLQPVAIRFLVALAKDAQNVFLTADSNQSIYGTGMSWKRVADDLNFVGRTHILKRNYRTTREIWRAVSQLLPDLEDKDTLSVEPVYRGSEPLLMFYSDLDAWSERLNSFIRAALREERLGPGSVAVLVPERRFFAEVVRRLDPRFRARTFGSGEVDITYNGVKVITMHSAKGLEFPIVAIAAVNDDILPGETFADDHGDRLARQQRLLFVASTRAMKQLMIGARADKPSRFVEDATGEYWQIERP